MSELVGTSPEVPAAPESEAREFTRVVREHGWRSLLDCLTRRDRRGGEWDDRATEARANNGDIPENGRPFSNGEAGLRNDEMGIGMGNCHRLFAMH